MYNLELNKVIEEIKKQKAKIVCIQLADGLKYKAKEIADVIEKKTKAKCLIWFESCYGACDYPELKDIDLLIQFGHNNYSFQ